MLQRQLGDDAGADHARGVAAERRVQHRGRELGLRHRAGGLERLDRPALRRLVAEREADQHLRQRADLHRLALEARRLDPGVLLRRPRTSVYFGSVSSSNGCFVHSPSYQAWAIDSVTLSRKYGLVEGLDLLDGREVAADDRAAGQVELRALRVERQVGHGEVVRHAGAVAEPVRIHRGDGADVDEVDLLDERAHLVEDVLDREELVHVERGLVVEVDGVGHAADGEVLDVRRLAAEDRDDLVDLALVLERLQVVRDREQVHLRRQLHRRVAPVAVGEDAELARLDEALELVLHRLQLHPCCCRGQGERLSASAEALAGSALSAETTSTQSSADRW